MEELAPYAGIIRDFGVSGILLIGFWAFYNDKIMTIGNHNRHIESERARREVAEKREEEVTKRYDALLNLALSSSDMAKRAADIAESRANR